MATSELDGEQHNLAEEANKQLRWLSTLSL